MSRNGNPCPLLSSEVLANATPMPRKAGPISSKKSKSNRVLSHMKRENNTSLFAAYDKARGTRLVPQTIGVSPPLGGTCTTTGHPEGAQTKGPFHGSSSESTIQSEPFSKASKKSTTKTSISTIHRDSQGFFQAPDSSGAVHRNGQPLGLWPPTPTRPIVPTPDRLPYLQGHPSHDAPGILSKPRFRRLETALRDGARRVKQNLIPKRRKAKGKPFPPISQPILSLSQQDILAPYSSVYPQTIDAFHKDTATKNTGPCTPAQKGGQSSGIKDISPPHLQTPTLRRKQKQENLSPRAQNMPQEQDLVPFLGERREGFAKMNHDPDKPTLDGTIDSVSRSGPLFMADSEYAVLQMRAFSDHATQTFTESNLDHGTPTRACLQGCKIQQSSTASAPEAQASDQGRPFHPHDVSKAEQRASNISVTKERHASETMKSNEELCSAARSLHQESSIENDLIQTDQAPPAQVVCASPRSEEDRSHRYPGGRTLEEYTLHCLYAGKRALDREACLRDIIHQFCRTEIPKLSMQSEQVQVSIIEAKDEQIMKLQYQLNERIIENTKLQEERNAARRTIEDHIGLVNWFQDDVRKARREFNDAVATERKKTANYMKAYENCQKRLNEFEEGFGELQEENAGLCIEKDRANGKINELLRENAQLKDAMRDLENENVRVAHENQTLTRESSAVVSSIEGHRAATKARDEVVHLKGQANNLPFFLQQRRLSSNDSHRSSTLDFPSSMGKCGDELEQLHHSHTLHPAETFDLKHVDEDSGSEGDMSFDEASTKELEALRSVTCAPAPDRDLCMSHGKVDITANTLISESEGLFLHAPEGERAAAVLESSEMYASAQPMKIYCPKAKRSPPRLTADASNTHLGLESPSLPPEFVLLKQPILRPASLSRFVSPEPAACASEGLDANFSMPNPNTASQARFCNPTGRQLQHPISFQSTRKPQAERLFHSSASTIVNLKPSSVFQVTESRSQPFVSGGGSTLSSQPKSDGSSNAWGLSQTGSNHFRGNTVHSGTYWMKSPWNDEPARPKFGFGQNTNALWGHNATCTPFGPRRQVNPWGSIGLEKARVGGVW